MARLLYPESVEKVRRRIDKLSIPRRLVFWKTYRRLRRQSLNNPADTLSIVRTLQSHLETNQLNLVEVSLALKVASRFTDQNLAAQGATARSSRALAKEHFHLVRIQLKEALTRQKSSTYLAWEKGSPSSETPWVAVCDGSNKLKKSSAACVLYDPHQNRRAEVVVPLPPSTAVYSELHAAYLALKTAQAFQVTHLKLHVDSLATFRAFEGRLPLRYCLEEAQLQELVEGFHHVDVVLVPRTETQEADRLAATVSQS